MNINLEIIYIICIYTVYINIELYIYLVYTVRGLNYM